MSPRERKFLSPRSHDFNTRFGIHFRELLDRRKLGPSEFLERIRGAGVNVSGEAVRKWISGDHVPRPQDFEAIARVLGVKDYRKILPDPL